MHLEREREGQEKNNEGRRLKKKQVDAYKETEKGRITIVKGMEGEEGTIIL